MSENLLNNFILKILNNEESTVGRKLMLISMHEATEDPRELSLIENLYITQRKNNPILNYKLHDCNIHGHIPIGWSGEIHCEVCNEFLYRA